MRRLTPSASNNLIHQASGNIDSVNTIGSKLADFDIIKELGRGAYGVVYLARSFKNSVLYVLKKMSFNHNKSKK